MPWQRWFQEDKMILLVLVLFFSILWVGTGKEPAMRMVDLALGALIGLLTAKVKES